MQLSSGTWLKARSCLLMEQTSSGLRPGVTFPFMAPAGHVSTGGRCSCTCGGAGGGVMTHSMRCTGSTGRPHSQKCGFLLDLPELAAPRRATPSSQLFCITLMSLRPYEGGASPASGGRDAESLVWNAIGAATKLRRAVPRGLRSQAEGARLSGLRRGRRPWRRR